MNAPERSTVEFDRTHSFAILEEPQWKQCAATHLARVSPWTHSHRARRSRAEKHPVWDFLWEYYSFRPSQLERFSPGFGIELRGDVSQFAAKEWSKTAGGARLDETKFPSHRIAALRETRDLLAATAQRAPVFACFGLHEWAMVYRDDEVRHDVALRLSPSEIASVVEELGVRCSHFDAFRFFTPSARPLNVLQPTRETSAHHEQRGCIHVTMDLYKWAYKFWPWISSELVADTFLLTVAARELDMRASAYNLESFGFVPIQIEAAEGRRDYATAQRELAEQAQPLRLKLLDAFEHLCNAVD